MTLLEGNLYVYNYFIVDLLLNPHYISQIATLNDPHIVPTLHMDPI